MSNIPTAFASFPLLNGVQTMHVLLLTVMHAHPAWVFGYHPYQLVSNVKLIGHPATSSTLKPLPYSLPSTGFMFNTLHAQPSLNPILLTAVDFTLNVTSRKFMPTF
ncbi:hypothetical protein BDQ12DRAFT_720117 [Crucibulum laeve]|uniref:Uncharacterized protein n=1 Tax=Crucibulum laeve TaxID=68775 RepID=A0A5C3MBU5_9AGAR|nr:hypothetical protein BDQ12DRAFT_720117 [Crucibulum laeve]